MTSHHQLTTQRSLFEQQDGLVVAKAETALKLVSLYRALGGGWNPAPLSAP